MRRLLPTWLYPLALLACGGSGATSGAEGGPGDGLDASFADGGFEAAASPDAGEVSSDAGEGGAEALVDAAAFCPGMVPHGVCPEQAAWPAVLCPYPSEPCPNEYECQCVEGLGGPPTCSWTPYPFKCADAGEGGDSLRSLDPSRAVAHDRVGPGVLLEDALLRAGRT